MSYRTPPDQSRLRSAPPRGFGWIDHRLLSDGHFRKMSVPAVALYCLLVCAADRNGVSFYSDARLGELLGVEPRPLRAARRELVELGLLAYEAPVAQVLCLRSGRRATRPKEAPISARPLPRERAAAAAEWPMSRGQSLREMVKASLSEGASK